MRFVHVIARISSWVPFLLLSSVFDVNIAQFVYHFALDGPKSCLEFLSTLSKAPLDSGRLAFFYEHVFPILLDRHLRVEFQEHLTGVQLTIKEMYSF